MKFLGQGFQKFEHEQDRETDTHTDTQTDRQIDRCDGKYIPRRIRGWSALNKSSCSLFCSVLDSV